MAVPWNGVGKDGLGGLPHAYDRLNPTTTSGGFVGGRVNGLFYVLVGSLVGSLVTIGITLGAGTASACVSLSYS